MERIINIQQKLKCPKNQYNGFGNYKYRSCEDILEAVKPLLAKENLALIINDELISINERYYVKATATIYDKDGKMIISNNGYAREEENKKGQDGSQITGASSSYARKYALNGLFLIDDVKDSDTTNTGEGNSELASEKQIEILRKIFKTEETLKQLLDKYKLDKLEDISKSLASEIIKKNLSKENK